MFNLWFLYLYNYIDGGKDLCLFIFIMLFFIFGQ